MADVLRVSATEFARKFTTFRERVQTEGVIEVTAHDRTIGGFLSAAELSHYHAMKKREREVIRVSDMDDETMALILQSEYGKVSE
ncbi:hypothetical protein BTR14_09720 [Rhizobium rhizosphaerae]|uniref:Prevent-host-death protein n=1 Tax=Xaviernesmea rhizosphaerae TaxID=1672749 RepID=A0ABX3PDW1_9HYPH|nr:hypothetical protein [Xaviernesmea rhizosphaerae]OQP86709.1 hypothetical protein BTR14_09720 [Xaviernesmea rhizosphaerae]